MPQRCPACDELVEMPAAVRPSEYLIESELAALRAEVERLREALTAISTMPYGAAFADITAWKAVSAARAALEGKPQ